MVATSYPTVILEALRLALVAIAKVGKVNYLHLSIIVPVIALIGRIALVCIILALRC
jgi:hypothetical protein